MMRHIVALGLTSVVLATTGAQVVLGDGKGSVRAVNKLAAVGSSGAALEWSRNNFIDGTNGQVYGFYPAYTIWGCRNMDPFGESPCADDVTITVVDQLRSAPYFWPETFTVPRYLFRQGGANTNVSRSGDHSVRGPVWIKYELDTSNPNGWDIEKILVFTWDVRDITHKSSATKTRVFSDTQSPQQIDIYVASNDPDPTADPASSPNWTFVGSLKKDDGTLPNVCQWDPSTNNTFGECPAAFLNFLSGAGGGPRFYDDPDNEKWYSKLELSGRTGVRYIALVIPRGNQYGQDPQLASSTNSAASLQYTNITDVRVIARTGVPGDVNGSGCVDDADLLIVLGNFGQTGNNPADVNRDGTVDDADLLIVLGNFGRGCGS